MISEGFITGCSHFNEDPDADVVDSSLRVEDMRVDENDETLTAIQIFIAESAHTIGLTVFEAKQLHEALGEIINRYEPEGNK